MYQIVRPPFPGEPETIKRLSDNVFIPIDPDNRHYIEFMIWCATPGNEPLPADPAPGT